MLLPGLPERLPLVQTEVDAVGGFTSQERTVAPSREPGGRSCETNDTSVNSPHRRRASRHHSLTTAVSPPPADAANRSRGQDSRGGAWVRPLPAV